MVIFSTLSSQTVTLNLGEGRSLELLKKSEKRDLKSVDGETYFLYGVENSSTKLVSQGTVVLEFSKVLDGEELESFSKEAELQLIRKNSTGTYLFKNLSGENIVDKCNNLYRFEEVVSATPNWRRERKLK
jgi:hypothetical protein